MPRRKQLAITQRHFEVLNLLWEHGPMTVRELLERLPSERPLPYTTVLGLLQNMERAGLATHDVESQTHRYRALVSRQHATGTLLSDFLERFFRGSAERLVLGLVDAQKLSVADLREIETRLADNPAQAPPERPLPKQRRRIS
jgi:predicted transcriptional regulator